MLVALRGGGEGIGSVSGWRIIDLMVGYATIDLLKRLRLPDQKVSLFEHWFS